MINYKDIIKNSPVIPAVKEDEAFACAVKSRSTVIFLLKSDICTVKSTVQRARDAGKTIFVHMDLVDGFGKDESALKFMQKEIRPDGIITTKPLLIRTARQLDMPAIFRAFIFDNMSYQAAVQNIGTLKPDIVEILPALMPTIISRLHAATSVPIITGGLITLREEVVQCLKSGAKGVSTGCAQLWDENNLI